MSLAPVSQRVVVWFRNDLRVHDHNLLSASMKALTATSPATSPKKLLCVYCVDTRFINQISNISGYKRKAVFSTNFLLQSIANLRSNLRKIGADLLVTKETPEIFFPKLFSEGNSGGEVFVSCEHAFEEQQIVRQVTKQLKSLPQAQLQGTQRVQVKELDGMHTLYHPEDIPYDANCDKIPNTFTVYREKVEKQSKIRALLPSSDFNRVSKVSTDELQAVVSDTCSFDYLPSLEELGYSAEEIAALEASKQKGVLAFEGGEDAALTRLEQWAFRDDNLQTYFDIRNGMLGESYSSKLSPWLALGCISPRRVYWEVKRYEQERRIANKSTYWLIFELIWRDFYWFLCKKFHRNIFYSTGALGRRQPWRNVQDWITRWKTGRTGMPLVDANMRELLATGWMSNRGRQNVASYLVLDLAVDWRVGADHFESFLLDHDVYSNYGNWNAAAGLTGGRVNKFNIAKQSKDYDPQGDYIRYWLPELARVPAPLIFEPWKLSKVEQERYGVKLGVDYPYPIDANRPPDDASDYVRLGKKSMFSAGASEGVGSATVFTFPTTTVATTPASSTSAAIGKAPQASIPSTEGGNTGPVAGSQPNNKPHRNKSKFSCVQHL